MTLPDGWAAVPKWGAKGMRFEGRVQQKRFYWRSPDGLVLGSTNDLGAYLRYYAKTVKFGIWTTNAEMTEARTRTVQWASNPHVGWRYGLVYAPLLGEGLGNMWVGSSPDEWRQAYADGVLVAVDRQGRSPVIVGHDYYWLNAEGRLCASDDLMAYVKDDPNIKCEQEEPG